MSDGTVRVRVPEDAGGERLDRFIERHAGTLTRSAIRRLILDGRARVDGRPAAKAGLPLKPGMWIELDLPAPPSRVPPPETIALEVLHEDDDLLVVLKPAGMAVHPGHGKREGTLVNALLGRGGALSSIGAPDRPGIVHRLDEGTSGLLVVARNDAAHRALAAAFAERRVNKRYRALVWGHPEPSEGRIERSIGRSRANPVKMAVRGTRGRTRAALTEYRELERFRGFSFLDVTLRTGRTHQIRVHLQSIGHPIVGDVRYGGRPWRGLVDPVVRKAVREFDRLALHAADLAFEHPAGTGRVRFHAPLPPELKALLAVLRRSA